MEHDELVRAVHEVLTAVGGHERVPFEVLRVQTAGVRVEIEVVLHYFRASPVCCSLPGCYVPFLGLKREDVPGALACRLQLPVAPRVSMTVHLRHEPGYKYINLATGEPAGPGVDLRLEYPEDHFANAAPEEQSPPG